MRAALLAATAVALVTAVTAAPASGSTSPWAAYVAPVSACRGSDSVSSTVEEQQGAMACLVNWTRRRIGRGSLRWSHALAVAAETKASHIQVCGEFSHYPCGTRGPAAAIRHAAFRAWGENLYLAGRTRTSPRAALLAWLESPEHRRILFGRGWSDVGVTISRLPVFAGHQNVGIWVLEVATRVRRRV